MGWGRFKQHWGSRWKREGVLHAACRIFINDFQGRVQTPRENRPLMNINILKESHLS